MDNTNSTVNGIIQDIAGKQIIPYSPLAAIWQSWYNGVVNDFHNYRRFNGQEYVDQRKRGLNMAKTVCEDWADLLCNEKTEVDLPKTDKVLINDIFKQTNFKVKLSECIEKSFAVGTGCIVVGLSDYLIGNDTQKYQPSDDTKVTIEFYNLFDFKALNIRNHEIVECAFVANSTEYTDISIHTLNEVNEYVITNVKVDKKKGTIVDRHEIYTHSSRPWFFEIRPCINNNTWDYNDLGISIFANAIDVLKGIDDIFDSFCNEYILARMKVYISEKLYKVKYNKGNNRMEQTFDPYDTLYYSIPMGEDRDGSDKNLLELIAPDIRYDAHINGLNTMLNLLSKKVGFGTERYKFDKGSVATATQIISENSDMARSLRKQENLLRNILTGMVLVIKEVNNKFTKQPNFSDFSIKDIIINFDDSIIEDKNAIMERDRADVSAGLMSEVEYRMKHYGETEKDAENNIIKYFLYRELDRYTTALKEGVITPKEFVIKCYGKENAELETYIQEQLDKASVNPLDMFDESNNDSNKDNEDITDNGEEQ